MSSPRSSSLKFLGRSLVGAATVTAALTLAPSEANAFEKQWHVGADLGYVAYLGGTTAGNGVGGGIHAAYGLTDAFNLIGQLDLSGHPEEKVLVTGASVGAEYIVDILQWVPHVGLAVGAADIVSRDSPCGAVSDLPCHSPRLALYAPIGLDYQVSRAFTVGVAGRYGLLLGADALRQTIGVFARAEYVWGY